MNKIEKKLVNKDDLIELYYLKPFLASEIIRQTKKKLVAQGYDFYKNRRLGQVPHEVVKKYLNIA